MNEETKMFVTISKYEYDLLLKDSAFLAALESCGVDNWVGYSDAYNEINNEEED